MRTVNVSSLKNNPGEVLRFAREDMVLVMSCDKPDVLMVGVNQIDTLDIPGVRAALATALFNEGALSLARSARSAQMVLADFIAHVSRLGIPVISQTVVEVHQDMDTLDQWLTS